MIIDFRLETRMESAFREDQPLPSKFLINDKRVRKFKGIGRAFEIDWRPYFFGIFFSSLENT